MHLTVRLVAILLAVGLTPGAAEAVENSVHLLREGHLAHVAEHKGHAENEPAGDEHGCNSVFHACACHVSASFTVQVNSTEQSVPRAVSLPAAALSEMTLGASDGKLDSLLRPPIN